MVTPIGHEEVYHTIEALESFQIKLKPKNKIYRPGQNINGKLVIKNSGCIVCRAIRVSLEGTAIVSYLSENSRRMRTKIENLLDSSCSNTVFLVGSATQGSDQSHLVKKSTHEFPFTIPIVKMDPFPGTLKSKYGEIVYKVVAYIDNFYVKSPTRISEIVNIRGHLNLRSIPISEHPKDLSGRTRLSPLHEKTKFTLQLPCSLFIAEDDIPFKLTLIDIDPRDLEKLPTVCVSLLKKMTFKTDDSSRCIKKTLNSIDISTNDWNFVDKRTFWIVEWNGSLDIPDEAEIPTFSERYIQCLYFLKLEMQTESCFSSYAGELPITIGTTRKKLTAQDAK